jgi:hypothetical protein
LVGFGHGIMPALKTLKEEKHGTGRIQSTVEKLRWQCDPSIFEFECTKDLAPLREFIGQDRAVRSLEFA